MGPFPHDAPAAKISADNPMGTDGFEFVEYAHPNPAELHALFKLTGYAPVARHKYQEHHGLSPGRHQLSRQRSNPAPTVLASSPRMDPAPHRWRSAWLMPKQAYERALSLGAEPADIPAEQKTLDVPTIKGIGGSSACISLIATALRVRPMMLSSNGSGAKNPRPEGAGLFYLDHLTHNVHRGRMDVWTGFYEKLFNFRQIRFFRHRGPRLRPVLAGADQPGRQDPDSDQRRCGRFRTD